jgi:ArsR family transcriptional regulator, cadmium/lead-responsive transcriptional repressor
MCKMLKKEDYSLIGFILGSEYRGKILFDLDDKIKTPKILSKSTGIQINHVSNIIKDLSDKHLIECKNPEIRKGRLYGLTDKGKEILIKIKSL